MSYDALFQLGMGSVELDATQTEEPFAARALRVCAKVLHVVCQSERIGLAAFAVADLFRAERRDRGNSAKTLILPAGPARRPSKA